LQGSRSRTENFFTTRGDHHFSEKDSLFGTYLYDDTSYRYPTGLTSRRSDHTPGGSFVALEESHTFTPTLVNAVRVGYNRAAVANQQPLSAIDPLAKNVSLGSVPGKPAADVRIGGGIPEFLGGLGSANVYYYFWNSFQGYDDGFSHARKTFLEIRRGCRANATQLPREYKPRCTWGFANLRNFSLTNRASSLRRCLAVSHLADCVKPSSAPTFRMTGVGDRI